MAKKKAIGIAKMPKGIGVGKLKRKGVGIAKLPRKSVGITKSATKRSSDSFYDIGI